MRNTEKSRLAFDEAKQYMPGGVNSPVRSFANVGGLSLLRARRDRKFMISTGTSTLTMLVHGDQ